MFSGLPGAEVYYAEHRTYVGMTPAYLRRWGGARRIAVRRATKSTYCIESTVKGPKVHYDGPRGPARKGPCGFRGAVVPSPKRRPPPPPPDPEVYAAERRLNSAVAFLVAYYSDYNTYVGATVEKLRRYDPDFPDVTIVWTRPARFCVETVAGTKGTYHLLGPAEGPKPGACPAAGG
ncbi:MAG: hypothetical protein ACRDN6_02180 [Gaiellaceae bacterium]